jgi:hypothetical protein
MHDQKLTSTKRWLKNRRSQRIDLNVPVVVYRGPGEGPQFYENTQTLVVSAHGALMTLTDMVAPRQRLLVQNPNSGEHQECRVVSVKQELIGPPKVAVEFTRPAPSFWRIAFPPADWSALGQPSASVNFKLPRLPGHMSGYRVQFGDRELAGSKSRRPYAGFLHRFECKWKLLFQERTHISRRTAKAGRGDVA